MQVTHDVHNGELYFIAETNDGPIAHHIVLEDSAFQVTINEEYGNRNICIEGKVRVTESAKLEVNTLLKEGE